MASQSLCLSAQSSTFQTLDKIEGGFCNHEILARLVHFWEARNFSKGNILMGFELLLLDSEATAVQAFISANRLFRFEDTLKPNSVYKLDKFLVNPCKTRYKVSDHHKSICFTDQTTMVEVLEGNDQIPHHKFRLRMFADFSAIVDSATELFDVVGQLRLLSGDNLHSPTTREAPPQVIGNRLKDRVLVHLLMKDGETIRIYLWGNIAETFRNRWNTSDAQPVVLLITTLNPKTIASAVTLSSTSSTRMFFDADLAETKEFMTWLGAGSQHIPTVTSASSAITKLETVTLKEIQAFVQTEIPQVASFYCFATVIDVLDDQGWFYISCTCKTKLGKAETSLYCPTCKKNTNTGLIRYRFEITVRDENNDNATFVLFDPDGNKIAGKSTKDFLNDPREVYIQNCFIRAFVETNYPHIPSACKAAENDGSQTAHTKMHDCLKTIIGRTCKFQIILTPYNFGASRQTFTVSRIVEDDIEVQANSANELINVEIDEGNVEKKLGEPTNTESKSFTAVEITGQRADKRPRLEN